MTKNRSKASAVNISKSPYIPGYYTNHPPCIIPAGTAVLCIDTGFGHWGTHIYIIYKELTWIVDSVDYSVLEPSEKLLGKQFCFTGVMDKSRLFYKIFTELHGGVFSPKITKNLTALVVSDITSSSTKAIKARSNGVTCITEEEFLNMVNDQL